jgi:amidophosphoribosyltransferase
MGIDMATRKELIAAKKDVEAVRKSLGADSLGYISVDGLVEAIGHGEEDLCLACLTGEYPLDIEDDKYKEELLA